MNKVAFTPISIVSGLVAGFAASKLFELLWSKIDDEEAPEANQQEVAWGKLMLAMAIDGALFRVVRAATDRGTRVAYHRATGAWPGDDED
ncbi:hypothetical protein BH10ACT11_BH10ACT11_14250 [soil metagenome]